MLSGSGLQLPEFPGLGLWHTLAVFGGTLICVQDLETSSYLREEYDATTRIISCRLSQLIAAVNEIVLLLIFTV